MRPLPLLIAAMVLQFSCAYADEQSTPNAGAQLLDAGKTAIPSDKGDAAPSPGMEAPDAKSPGAQLLESGNTAIQGEAAGSDKSSAPANPPPSSNPGAQLLESGSTTIQDASAGSAAPDDSAADATLKLTGGALAAGIGYVWGHGTVNFQGSAHKFGIRGVSVVDVGANHLSAQGVVMHLDKLADFSGHYVAWAAGATVGGGGSAVYMKNEHGVVIKLLTSSAGLRFTLSGNGVRVRLLS